MELEVSVCRLELEVYSPDYEEQSQIYAHHTFKKNSIRSYQDLLKVIQYPHLFIAIARITRPSVDTFVTVTPRDHVTCHVTLA